MRSSLGLSRGPNRQPQVTTPVSRVPAGRTSRPSIVIGLVSSAVTGSSTPLVSDATELVKANGRVVPAGIVTSREPGLVWVVGKRPSGDSDALGATSAVACQWRPMPSYRTRSLASTTPSIRNRSRFMCTAYVV